MRGRQYGNHDIELPNSSAKRVRQLIHAGDGPPDRRSEDCQPQVLHVVYVVSPCAARFITPAVGAQAETRTWVSVPGSVFCPHVTALRLLWVQLTCEVSNLLF